MDYPKSDPTIGLVGGKFTDGNPGGGIAASRDPSSWANLVTDEMLNVLAAGGIAPDEAVNTQLLAAIQAITTARFTGSNQSLLANGYQKLPGGLILQWGTAAGSSGGFTNYTFPITYPNAALLVVGSGLNSTSGPTIFLSNDVWTTTQFGAAVVNASGVYLGFSFSWISIGY